MTSINFSGYGRDLTIELKSIKYSDFASHETNCYEAVLVIDGKRIGLVHNDGHGGPDGFWPDKPEGNAVYDEVNSWLKANVKGCDGECDQPPLMKDLEWVCGDLVDQHLLEKELKKLLRGKALFVQDGEMRQLAWKGVRTLTPRHLEAAREGGKRTLLNDMPFDDALALFKRYAT